MLKKFLNSEQFGKKIYFTVFLLMICPLIFAQQLITVKGKVTSNGEPLAGATISTKSDLRGTTTNSLGQFTIQANKGDTLIVSFVGYEEKHIAADNSKMLDISLNSNVAYSLGDVVVVGYGTQSKRNLATSTVRVSSSDFENTITSTVDQALQGRAAGVQIVNTSGEPGAQAVVRIRGNNSLSGNNEPLYVIDGFPMPPYQEASTQGFSGSYSLNGLYGLNPNDIDNIEVLKDAAATAIYGSRGANGVVLITTKTGKSGGGKIELINKFSFGSISKPIKMMTGKEYAQIVNETYELVGSAKPFRNIDTVSVNTNWFDEVTRQSMREEASLNISGGGPKSSYFVSGNYLKEIGNLLASGNSRGSIRANLNSDVKSWYSIKGQFSFVRQVTDRGISSGHSWPASGGLMDYIRQPPTIPIDYLGYNSLGIPGTVGYWFGNPVIAAKSRIDKLKNDFSLINIENLFTLSSSLKLVINFGTNQSISRRQVFLDANTSEGHGTNGVGSNTLANVVSYNTNAYLIYDKLLADIHKLNLTLGGEYNSQTNENLGTASTGFSIPFFGINNIGSAQAQQINSYREDRKLQSAFFRGNYILNGKYILNTSVRLDGASPFAENKKYGLFSTIAAAWNIGQEEFIKNLAFISSSKLRVSYGQTGSQAISPYSSLQPFVNALYQIGAGNNTVLVLYPSALGNPDLSWEKTNQFNVGIDLSVLNNRLSFSLDYYDKRTINLLQPQSLPSQSGYSSIISNYGTMGNKGIEFSVLANLIKNENVDFSTRLNISRNKNILISLGNNKISTYTKLGGNLQGGVATILTPGREIGLFYGYKVTGLAQASDFNNGVPNYPFPGAISLQHPGTYIYQDSKKDGVINADDRQVLGKSSPDFTFGWNSNFRWKNIYINLFITGSKGNDILDISQFYLRDGLVNNSNVVFNQSQDWYEKRWTQANPHNDVRYPGVQANDLPIRDIISPMIEDGSYIRLKSLAVSYGFPKLNVIKNLKLFITATNLITITKYTGFDPEVSSYNQSLLLQGIDYGAYPSEKSFSFGLSCNF